MTKPIKRALLSVSDKRGIGELGRALAELGVEILSTGGTARTLTDGGVPVKEVSAHTGFPEMMDGRVKTLHPKIHGGLLGRRGQDDAVMAEYDISPIDLVVVNLYPFEQTVANPDTPLLDAIENIDIGGPAMLRSAAKNHADVAVLVDTADYSEVIAELRANGGGLTDERRFALAAKAFAHTCSYDGAIANYLSAINPTTLSPRDREVFPETFSQQFVKTIDMRYGENPHQRAAFYLSLIHI